jgi:hypothetical protein
MQVRRVRAGEKRFKRKTATLFYRLMQKLWIARQTSAFRLVDRKAPAG